MIGLFSLLDYMEISHWCFVFIGWLFILYIEIYWILGIGNSFSKFCTMINTTISNTG
jgi:hypothetical protein